MIAINHLSKRFGTHFALRDVTLAIGEGERIALLGPNGAGKSTLLSLLATLSRPSSGEIAIRGTTLTSSWHDIRRYMGLVSHQSLLYPDLTAYENLQFYADLYGVTDATTRIEEVLTWVDLLPRAKERVRGYSRGMTQRLSIARALLHNPQILLLDEPFSGLDEAAAERLQALLNRIHAEEPARSTLMTTHDLARGLNFASRVLILKRGRVVLDAAITDYPTAAWRDKYLELVA